MKVTIKLSRVRTAEVDDRTREQLSHFAIDPNSPNACSSPRAAQSRIWWRRERRQQLDFRRAPTRQIFVRLSLARQNSFRPPLVFAQRDIESCSQDTRRFVAKFFETRNESDAPSNLAFCDHFLYEDLR
ncbi:MAG: hypothetical protein ACD_65C00319G0002 [uncultured bacterium]|nr:MAG: hypothetical protein ACD_65C00319G0002 [uncultured bacterium]